jgi:Fe-S oxidoreductase
VLDRLGVGYQIKPSGCCGMAGSFGSRAPSTMFQSQPLNGSWSR